MRADNTRHIVAAAQHRHEYTRAKAIQALREAEKSGTPVTFDAVATAAGVSRSWLYTQPDLRAEIERLRAASQRAPGHTHADPATSLRCVSAAAPRSSQRTQPAARRGEPPAARPARPGPRRAALSPIPRTRQTLQPIVSARQRSARAEQPPSTSRSHVENTVRSADAQAREREVDQAKDNAAAGRAFVGLDDGRLHDRGPGRAEPDAAVRAGPRVQGRGTAVSRKTVSYRWHLRRLMAGRGMFATTDLGPPLAARGITLSREQVYRLVTGVPERLSLPALAALCDILDCGPGDLIEPVRKPARRRSRPPSRRSGPGRCGRGSFPGPAHGDGPLPGRPRASRRRRQAPACPQCRRDTLIRHVITVDGTLPASAAAAAVDAAAATPAALRSLASALAADPDMLRHGAPPLAGRLAAELIARGSVLAVPACARCGRDGRPLFRTAGGGMCKPAPPACAPPPALTAARSRRSPAATPPASPSASGAAGTPGATAPAGTAAGRPRSRCGRVTARRTSASTATGCPPPSAAAAAGTVPATSPAATARSARRARRRRPPACARCGQDRPPQARWPEGPVCDTCYTAALRRRARCAGCGQERRLVFPPGPDAVTCADCAGLPVMSACAGCGTEDKLYEKGLCARCSLRRRATLLLSGGTGDVPATMSAVLEAICAARNPRSALNWLRKGAGAALLADIAAGRAAATHEALDEHPRPRAAGFLRQCSPPAASSLPATRNSPGPSSGSPACWNPWTSPSTGGSSARSPPGRSCAGSGRRPGQAPPPDPHRHARNSISEAARFLAWLSRRGTTLRQCRQADIDEWLTTASASASESTRGFLAWAARHGHCPAFAFPARQRHAGPAISDSQRWEHATRLLRDDTTRARRPGRRLPGPALRPERHPHRRAHHQPGHPPRRGRAHPARQARHPRPARPRHDPGHPHHRREALHRHRHARDTATGCSPGCCPDSRSRPSACPHGSTPSASPSGPHAGPPSPASQPRSPPPCSPTPSASTRPRQSTGHTTPDRTGTGTQPS